MRGRCRAHAGVGGREDGHVGGCGARGGDFEAGVHAVEEGLAHSVYGAGGRRDLLGIRIGWGEKERGREVGGRRIHHDE